MVPRKPTDLPVADALRIGLLALAPQRWIHRRVEELSYIDLVSSRRRISLDFTVPEGVSGHSQESPYPLFLPMAQFVKRPLTRFDLHDVSGESIPMLTSRENGVISTAVLLALARLQRERLVDPIVEKYLPRLVYATTGPERELAIHRIFDPRTEVGRTLWADAPFRTLALELSRNFMLYLPASTHDAGRRRIVKLAFDAPDPPPVPSTLPERLGWRAVEDQFVVANAGSAQSYHFELVAPAEMHFTGGAFAGRRNAHPTGDRIVRPTRRAHLRSSGLDRGQGLVFVALQANTRMLYGTALFAVLSAFALLFVRLRVEHFAGPQASSDGIVAALLVAPGLMATYLTRPGEHPTLSAFLSGVRFLAGTSVLLAVVGAFVLFAGYSPGQAGRALTVLTIVSGLVATALVRTAAKQRLSHRQA